jgi:hypothetical protein
VQKLGQKAAFVCMDCLDGANAGALAVPTSYAGSKGSTKEEHCILRQLQRYNDRTENYKNLVYYFFIP